MSNQLATVSLPPHLAVFRNTTSAIAKNITGGISAGKAHPKISIRQSRFRLVDAENVETPWDALSINLIILDANPFVSKRYYASAYNPNATEAVAPDCFSDNGIGPSAAASKPQCKTCSACPHNVWGSKITPSGKKSRSCGDSKRLAVMVADEDDGLVYELSVPAASMKDLHEVITKLDRAGVPAQSVVFNVSFDSKEDFPKLTFKPTGYITAEQAQVVQSLLDTEEVKEAIGTNDNVAPVVKEEPETAPFILTGVVAEPEAPKPAARRGRPAKADKVEEPKQEVLFPQDMPKAAPPVEVSPKTTSSELDDAIGALFK